MTIRAHPSTDAPIVAAVKEVATPSALDRRVPLCRGCHKGRVASSWRALLIVRIGVATLTRTRGREKLRLSFTSCIPAQ